MEEPEIEYWYPQEWVDEYKRTGTVQCWREDYPHIFDGSRGTPRKIYADNKTFNLSTYALMYLLKRDEGVESLTYFRLAARLKSKDAIHEALQKHMRRWMGDELFERLRAAIHNEKGLNGTGFQGEPDLFCWNPLTGEWYFAEAKGSDRLTDSQRLWFSICRATIPGVVIKVCRVRPRHDGKAGA